MLFGKITDSLRVLWCRGDVHSLLLSKPSKTLPSLHTLILFNSIPARHNIRLLVTGRLSGNEGRLPPAMPCCLVMTEAAAEASLELTAMPTSAAARAAKSFTPSPQYMATLPSPCSHQIRVYGLSFQYPRSACTDAIPTIHGHLA